MELSANPSHGIYAAAGGSIYYIYWSNSPANASWTDISFDLPNHGVQAINAIARRGTRIFIATDNGVYYKGVSSNETSWNYYSHHLPNVNVKDIKLVNNSVYVGTYGRGVWFASSPDCDTTGDTLHVWSTTPPFNTDQTIYDVVDVHPGATMTVTATLKMGANAKIIVERNATLDVNGGTLTKACPDLWPGVEVWGDINHLQYPAYQGTVILRNNATLEFARKGIATSTTTGVTAVYLIQVVLFMPTVQHSITTKRMYIFILGTITFPVT